MNLEIITAEEVGEQIATRSDVWNINIGLPGAPPPVQTAPSNAAKTRRNIYIGLAIVAVLIITIFFIKNK